MVLPNVHSKVALMEGDCGMRENLWFLVLEHLYPGVRFPISGPVQFFSFPCVMDSLLFRGSIHFLLLPEALSLTMKNSI